MASFLFADGKEVLFWKKGKHCACYGRISITRSRQCRFHPSGHLITFS